MVKRIETLIDEAAEPLNARHLEEADALQERIEATATRKRKETT